MSSLIHSAHRRRSSLVAAPSPVCWTKPKATPRRAKSPLAEIHIPSCEQTHCPYTVCRSDIEDITFATDLTSPRTLRLESSAILMHYSDKLQRVTKCISACWPSYKPTEQVPDGSHLWWSRLLSLIMDHGVPGLDETNVQLLSGMLSSHQVSSESIHWGGTDELYNANVQSDDLVECITFVVQRYHTIMIVMSAAD